MLPAPPDDGVGEEAQIALITSNEAVDINSLLQKDPDDAINCNNGFRQEQLKDPALHSIITYRAKEFY